LDGIVVVGDEDLLGRGSSPLVRPKIEYVGSGVVLQKRNGDADHWLAGRRRNRMVAVVGIALLLIALVAQAGGPQTGCLSSTKPEEGDDSLLRSESCQGKSGLDSPDPQEARGDFDPDQSEIAAGNMTLHKEDDLAAARAWLKAGLAWEEKGDRKQANEAYCQALNLTELSLSETKRTESMKRSHGWELQGCVLERLGRAEEALVAYENALDADPSRSRVRYMIADLLAGSLGRYDQALQVFEQALEMDPDKVAALVKKGDVLLSIGEFDQAAQNLDLALEIAPDSYRALTSSGLLNAALGRYDQALHLFDQALYINPSWARGWLGKGEALRKLGKHNESLQAYESALLLQEPKLSGEALIGKGQALENMGRFKEASLVMLQALGYYQSEVKRTPRSASSLTGLGDAFLGLGQIQKAVDAYNSAIEINRNSPQARQRLELALRKLDAKSQSR